jgi:2-deoxy-D-gluconate 3-dehydrogenase
MAEGLARAGAAILIAGRNVEKNNGAVQQLEVLGGEAASRETDVTDAAALRELMAYAVERFGRLDILVNNAGISVRKAPQDLALEEWQSVIDTNLTSAFVAAQAAYPHMLKSGGGKVINIGSMLSIFGLPFAAAYAASKGGIVQLTKALATAWAKDNVQVNAILPGWIDTDLTRAAREQVPGLHERVLARTPAGRWGVPEDFAGVGVFLASRASDFLTGAAIPVDGGYSTQG